MCSLLCPALPGSIRKLGHLPWWAASAFPPSSQWLCRASSLEHFFSLLFFLFFFLYQGLNSGPCTCEPGRTTEQTPGLVTLISHDISTSGVPRKRAVRNHPLPVVSGRGEALDGSLPGSGLHPCCWARRDPGARVPLPVMRLKQWA